MAEVALPQGTVIHMISILPRSAWTNDSYPINARLRAKGIVLHHTASPNVDPAHGDAEISRIVKEIRSIDEYHRKHNGWKDIGYHFVISRGGLIVEARRGSALVLKDGLIVTGAHCPTKNTTHVGICLEGNYQLEDLPSIMWESLVRLMAHIAMVAKFDLNRQTVLLHREVRKTVCPGDHVAGKIQAIIDHANRVLKNLQS